MTTDEEQTWKGLADDRMARYVIEEKQKWREAIEEIPFLTFPAGWQVRVIPPFGDAVVRFQVKLPSGNRKSIYLDSRNSLGIWGGSLDKPEPYWEVYPVRGDVARCDQCDTDRLMELIADESKEEPT